MLATVVPDAFTGLVEVMLGCSVGRLLRGYSTLLISLVTSTGNATWSCVELEVIAVHIGLDVDILEAVTINRLKEAKFELEGIGCFELLDEGWTFKT